MPITRERQIKDEVYEQIPAVVRDVFSDPKALKEFATAIVENETPPLPTQGEWTHSGRQRLFGPVSPYNGFLGFGLYNSADIPLNVLDLMRRDSQVALGMAIVKFPITQLKFTVNCKNPVIKQFIRFNLENQWGDIVRNALKSLDFGFMAFEKVWQRQNLSFDPGLNLRKVIDRDFITLKKIKPIHPATIRVRTDKNGNFAGINQDQTGQRIELPRDKSMIITNDEEFGNFFGRSRMVSSYEPWYWKQISTQFFLRFIERYSIPPYKVTYPSGQTRFTNGEQMDNAAIAMQMAEAISSYGNVAVPSATDDKGNRKWNVESISQGKVNIKSNDIVGFWNISILRGLLIPDKEAASAMDPDTASKVYLSTLAGIVNGIQEKVNTEIVKPLVLWNFDEKEREDCSVNIDDIDFKKRMEMRKLLSKVLDMSATYIKNTGGVPFKNFVDMDKIYENLDVPFTEARVYMPDFVDKDGNVLKSGKEILAENGAKKKDSNTKGPEDGEETSGNKAREGRDGEPRDTEKQDAKDAL